MGDYKLSASLEEHEDDVRGVVYPNPSFVLSASRDATVRLWKLLSSNPPKYDCSISSHGSAFINAIAYLPPTPTFPGGLVISGGKDTIVEVRQPGKPPDESAEALLLGHSHNVCALDVSAEGNFVVSGSWDGSARVWGIGNWKCEVVLEGHEGSVWTVLAYNQETIITGCADKHIRIFSSSGKLLYTVKASTDVVRTLCRVPANHSSKADFASAGNDGIVRLWRLDGRQVGELHGHEDFIYSLASLPSGELASSGEDRTVRIWRGSECVQTITHPAISVWGVAACSENGDIVSGASDRKVRIFSRIKERQADSEATQAFEDSVKSSSIPQQQVGEVQKDKLPGPEFLTQNSGTKEGQVLMIREANGSVGAYQWSQGGQKWLNVGTVVDAVGSSGKKVDYAGKSYDYVFDVDIEDGKPPLKLPFDLSQNPYEAATKFIQDNELPVTYLDQVANFIITNTQGATFGQTSQDQPTGLDPYGMENRYRPGDATSISAPAPATTATSRPKVLPQTAYLSIKTANIRTILKKIQELNQQLVNEGAKDLSLNQSQLSDLSDSTVPLETLLSGSTSQVQFPNDSILIILHIATAWPPALRLPGLDLLRLLTASSPLPAIYDYPTNQNLISLLSESGVFTDKDRPNNIMLATRALSNLFETPAGRDLAEKEFDQIHELIKAASKGSTNRNLTIAVATLWVNYAVLLTSAPHKDLPSSLDRANILLDDLATLMTTATDSEAVYRALVAAGTLLGLGEDVTMAAKEVYDYAGALSKAEGSVREPRVKGVAGEIREGLK